MKKGTAIFPGWLFPFVYCVAGVDAYKLCLCNTRSLHGTDSHKGAPHGYLPLPLVQDSGQHAFGANAMASAKPMTELTAKRGAFAPRVSPAHDQNAINF